MEHPAATFRIIIELQITDQQSDLFGLLVVVGN